VRGAGRARSLHVHLFFLGQYHRAHDARAVAPKQQGDDDDDVAQAWSKHSNSNDRDRKRRDAQREIREPHDHVVDVAAVVAGYQAEQRTDDADHDGRRKTDDESDARAENQFGEDVLRVSRGAEPVLRRRPFQARKPSVGRSQRLERVVRCDQIAENGDGEKYAEGDEAAQRKAIPDEDLHHIGERREEGPAFPLREELERSLPLRCVRYSLGTCQRNRHRVQTRRLAQV
jgi:hypothetical protein